MKNIITSIRFQKYIKYFIRIIIRKEIRTKRLDCFLVMPGQFRKVLFFFIILLSVAFSEVLAQNAIVLENAIAGNPASEWQISGAGDLTIQGYATDISYNKGETARFKIKTNANAYTINIPARLLSGKRSKITGKCDIDCNFTPIPTKLPYNFKYRIIGLWKLGGVCHMGDSWFCRVRDISC